MLHTSELYQCYTPGQPLDDAFPSGTIPVIQMEHLRQLDFMINRGYFYELTVFSFLLQLFGNESLRSLREHNHMVVLLNEEGVLVRDQEVWRLYFRPEASESHTLSMDADMLSVYEKIIDDWERGTVQRIDMPVKSIASAVLRHSRVSILDEYCRQYPGGYLAVAKNIVRNGTDELFAHVPVCRYGSLATVDPEEIESYRSIKALMDDYLYQYDHRKPAEKLQPLSIAVFGAPGSGKSFGVKQIARSCGRFHITTLNLSQFNSADGLFAALEIALTNEDAQIPLVFFDEFDSDMNGVKRGWLKYMLAPMQDGEYTLSGKTHSIESAVFVFAGGTAVSFNAFLPQTAEQTERFKEIKGPDFVSRLKGTLNIKGLNPMEITDHTYIIRRAMLLRDIILRKFPDICDHQTGEMRIAEGLLSALLRVSKYRHGTRSLEFILSMSRLQGASRFTASCLPMPAQLDIHLDIEDFSRKLMFEQLAGGKVDTYARAAHAAFIERAKMAGAYNALNPRYADWENLSEPVKDEYRTQFRYYGEKLPAQNSGLSIRPIRDGQSEGLKELYGPELEVIAKVEHERRCGEMLAEGWRQGAEYDEVLRISPYLTAYEDLPEKQKDTLRLAARDVPSLLKTIGLELVRASKGL